MNQGTRWVLLMQKNRRRKSHAWAPLRSKEESNDVKVYKNKHRVFFIITNYRF
jgi:hypothetical protein